MAVLKHMHLLFVLILIKLKKKIYLRIWEILISSFVVNQTCLNKYCFILNETGKYDFG